MLESYSFCVSFKFTLNTSGCTFFSVTWTPFRISPLIYWKLDLGSCICRFLCHHIIGHCKRYSNRYWNYRKHHYVSSQEESVNQRQLLLLTTLQVNYVQWVNLGQLPDPHQIALHSHSSARQGDKIRWKSSWLYKDREIAHQLPPWAKQTLVGDD